MNTYPILKCHKTCVYVFIKMIFSLIKHVIKFSRGKSLRHFKEISTSVIEKEGIIIDAFNRLFHVDTKTKIVIVINIPNMFINVFYWAISLRRIVILCLKYNFQFIQNVIISNQSYVTVCITRVSSSSSIDTIL